MKQKEVGLDQVKQNIDKALNFVSEQVHMMHKAFEMVCDEENGPSFFEELIEEEKFQTFLKGIFEMKKLCLRQLYNIEIAEH